jgi:fructose-1,6-bisphosphatase/inositol monophosphatase family enzyme
VPDAPIDRVASLIREVAATVVLPRWRHLESGEIHQKSPGDLVTIADQESEEALAAGLRKLLPGSTVVGEEGVAADSSLLARVGEDGDVWIVDPVDGTNNFAAGKYPFAVMVALLRDREPVAGWILDVVEDKLTVAEAGGGAFRDGVRLTTRTDSPPAADLTGMVSGNQLPGGLRSFGTITDGRHCAGYEYPALALDEQQFAVFWRTMPWDHVAGSLIVREAGGTVRRFSDGEPYRPTDYAGGLMAAANDDIWQTAWEALRA